jgi:dipeptidyl aminopeptidase/acylaminoacyl peptidase
MNLKEIKEMAWISDECTEKPIRGVVLRFHGMGDGTLREKPDFTESFWVRDGALVVYPYYGLWTWMNRQCRKYVDELVASVYKEYKLNPRLPLIATGGSMGGHAALLYTRYAKKPVTACMPVFPPTDLKAHFHERRDLPRTIHYAFRGYKEPYSKLLKEHSPLDQTAKMPRIPYLVIHGEADKIVSKKLHSDPFVAKMRKLKHDIEYMEVPGMEHGNNVPIAVELKQAEFIRRIMGVKCDCQCC